MLPPIIKLFQDDKFNLSPALVLVVVLVLSLDPKLPSMPPGPPPKPLPLPLLPAVVVVVALYVIKKDEELRISTVVNTSSLVVSSSMTVASVTPSLDDEVEATQFVNVTLPKSANATRASFSSKSSTIHSAFWPSSAEVELSDMVAVLPVVTFSIVATPVVLEVAVTDVVTF